MVFSLTTEVAYIVGFLVISLETGWLGGAQVANTEALSLIIQAWPPRIMETVR